MTNTYPGYRIVTAQIGRQAHPDVLANRIAQQGVAEVLSRDPAARADLNVILGNKVYFGGQIRSENPPEEDRLREIIIKTVKGVGYSEEWGYDISKVPIIIDVNSQSPNINNAVNNGGAGDTIRKCGFATSENEKFLPFPHLVARDIAYKLDRFPGYSVREMKKMESFLGPDGKVNVAVAYEGGEPKYVSDLIVGAQHSKDINKKDLDELISIITNDIVRYLTVRNLYDSLKTKILVNGAGLFGYGGPIIDRGVKGKKDADHTYGDIVGHTGGSAYGKDGSKVDLHALLLARQIALSIVKSRLAKAVKVQLGYAIGQEEPYVLDFDTMGTSLIQSDELERTVKANFKLKPKEVIENLDLSNPEHYVPMAKYFFGNASFPWEKAVELRGT